MSADSLTDLRVLRSRALSRLSYLQRIGAPPQLVNKERLLIQKFDLLILNHQEEVQHGK